MHTKNRTIIFALTTTTSDYFESLDDQAVQTKIKSNQKIQYWEIALLVYIGIVIIILFLCCICSSFLKYFGKYFNYKKKINYITNAINFKTPTITSYKEEIQPGSKKSTKKSQKEQPEAKAKENELGSLEYGIDYDFQKEELNITVFKAMSLKAKDANGTSDPYIKIYLLPDKKTKYQTRMLRKTLNPIYNEIFTFKNLKYHEVKKKILVFKIYDYDRFTRHDEIGEIKIPLENIDLANVIREWRDIESGEADENQLGSICFSLRYTPTAGKLTVTIFEAKHLKKMDIGRLSDPYVKVGLYKNGKRIEKQKTSIKFYTLNPYYNEAITFDRVLDSELKQGVYSLVITVVDYDRIGASDPIGKVLVGPSAYGNGLRHWVEMIEAPRRPIAYWHNLVDIEDD